MSNSILCSCSRWWRSGERLRPLALTLSQTVRRNIWLYATIFGILREFVTCSVESVSAFLFEERYGLDPTTAGMMVGATFFAGLPAGVYFAFRHGKAAKDQTGIASWNDNNTLMRRAAVTMSFASIFLSTWLVARLGLQRESGKFLVLIADTLMFPMGFLASGIFDGLAFQCSDDSGMYTVQNFLTFDVFLRCAVARATGPLAGRWLVDKYGQNAYAGVQLALTSLGLFVCLCVPYLSVDSQGKKLSLRY